MREVVLTTFPVKGSGRYFGVCRTRAAEGPSAARTMAASCRTKWRSYAESHASAETGSFQGHDLLLGFAIPPNTCGGLIERRYPLRHTCRRELRAWFVGRE